MRSRLTYRVVKILQWFRIVEYFFLSSGKKKGKACYVQPVLIVGEGFVEFENRVQLGYYPSPFFLNGYIHLEARGRGTKVRIGTDTKINNNFVAIAEHTSISIGKRCLIGFNVEIYDSDFHGIPVRDRNTSTAEMAKAVRIGDDVFIGSNVKILKGAIVGDGSVIANGSIVLGEIPPDVVAGGNPAKVLKVINS